MINLKKHMSGLKTHNKAMKNRPQKAWAGLATARLLLRRYVIKGLWS